MKKASILIFAKIIFIQIVVVGQGQILNSNYLTTRYSLERISTEGIGNNSILPGLAPPSGELVGDPFLTLTFNSGNYVLYDGTVVRNVPGKLDILRNEIYFKTAKGIRVFDGQKVKSFWYSDSLTSTPHTFINSREFNQRENDPEVGFLEIIQDGPVALLKKSKAYIIKSNYNQALNVGSRDDKIKKTYKFYYWADEVLNELPKKTLTKIFGDKKNQVDDYIKVNNLDIREQKHLKLIFEYANTLSKS